MSGWLPPALVLMAVDDGVQRQLRQARAERDRLRTR